MHISIGCDHSALELKAAIKEYLESLGHEVKDYGTFSRIAVIMLILALRLQKT